MGVVSANFINFVFFIFKKSIEIEIGINKKKLK